MVDQGTYIFTFDFHCTYYTFLYAKKQREQRNNEIGRIIIIEADSARNTRRGISII